MSDLTLICSSLLLCILCCPTKKALFSHTEVGVLDQPVKYLIQGGRSRGQRALAPPPHYLAVNWYGHLTPEYNEVDNLCTDCGQHKLLRSGFYQQLANVHTYAKLPLLVISF